MIMLVRGAQVEGEITGNGLEVVINDQFKHTFGKQSSPYKLLNHFPRSEVVNQLNGGTFLISDNSLVDYRDSTYKGFIHSDDSIKALTDTLGVNKIRKRNGVAGVNLFDKYRSNSEGGKHEMGREWERFEFKMNDPDVDEGGEFEMRTRFTWSPFINSVGTRLEVERLICTNGMVAMSSLFNLRIPLVNMWEEGLNIASNQIKDFARELFNERLTDMKNTRASVELMSKIESLALNRRKELGFMDGSEWTRLGSISQIASPSANLGAYYKPSVLNSKSLSAYAESHLTLLDGFNLLTEIDSHTQETSNSSSREIQKIISGIVFDGQYRAHKMKNVDISSDSDFNRAFFAAAA